MSSYNLDEKKGILGFFRSPNPSKVLDVGHRVTISHYSMFDSVNPAIDSPGLINFIFAMPFLIHPFVFGMFGKAMSSGGEMPKKIVAILASVGIIGVIFSLVFL